ncbi:MAG: 50S ribosomal protein L20 [Candidatus Niyogibacteria bacterium CG10_big_fil_rev_8_21_14_0_10_42_19]|uniref:Large ribosomal subunit protein bL20 n=1 Tax=Candidatus Niyogibacteria bacterium CG10_big_fil_rev_8_21_14_0_10_42_19 TaxID=1974725 RepID=A0A2H0TGJ7_9BACT|nr:MAG: 50S ribosomal protein L20 [Candidatus Niyogibacteria bacterium CG10_big_fil_rev_8_21_14_0_10_42_19]
MVRVKRGKISIKRRRNVLKQAKGFRWGGKSKEKEAKVRLLHAGVNSFQDRRKKKGSFRRLWQVRINAASRKEGVTYSKLINNLKKAEIKINRKMLSEIAAKNPETFVKIIEASK